MKLGPRLEPKAEGDEGSDAKRLRLDPAVKGGDGMVGKGAGSPRERDGRATVAHEQEDEHAMVRRERRMTARTN